MLEPAVRRLADMEDDVPSPVALKGGLRPSRGPACAPLRNGDHAIADTPGQEPAPEGSVQIRASLARCVRSVERVSIPVIAADKEHAVSDHRRGWKRSLAAVTADELAVGFVVFSDHGAPGGGIHGSPREHG